MKALGSFILPVVIALNGFSQTQSAPKKNAISAKLIGAWRLVSMEEPGPSGKLNRITDRKGMLIYTRDGHMSVQVMLPEPESNVSNDYVLNGYEASFGTYEVNEAAHTVTHHVQGSITRGLVGKDLPRLYEFTSDGHLIIKSTRPDEHWTVTWEHD